VVAAGRFSVASRFRRLFELPLASVFLKRHSGDYIG
jgi:hypothetical protein